ncbi:hypothetical protein [Kribbella sp. NPDC006257]|uniref:hypothetical protein n=1 Tax=Kribbella sp. NPDC006257 TaxID=3156738 RepID=UPI0033A7ED70
MKTFEAWRTWTDAESVLRERLPAEVIDRLVPAYRFAEEWHADQVRDEFGEQVAELVAWVTKPEPGPGEDKTAVRTAYLGSFIDAPPDVLVVKLSDRYSNVQRLDTHPRPEKQASYYAETLRWIVPLTAKAPQFVEVFSQWQDKYAYLGREERTGHA